MSVIDELKEIKHGFMAKDRRKAMEALMSVHSGRVSLTERGVAVLCVEK